MGDMWIFFIVGWRLISRMLRYLGRGALLVPVAAMGMALFGFRPWTLAALVLAVIVAVWRPALATVLLPVTMVVAGISGLVAAATEPGANFWTVTALTVLKGRLSRRSPGVVKRAIGKVRRPPVIVRHVIVKGQVRTARLAMPGVTSRAVRIPPRTTMNWTPAGPGIQGVAPAAGPGTQVWVKGSPALAWQTLRGGGGAVHVSYASGVRPGGGLWPGGLLVPLALLLLTLGLWLLPRSLAGLRTHAAALVSSLRRRMLENRWGILLVPVALLGLTVFGVHLWTVAALLACLVTTVRWPVIAADLVPVALTAFAVRGFTIAASWPSALAGLERPGMLYGIIEVTTRQTAMLAGAEASAFLVMAAWLVPRTIGAHARTALLPGRDLELEGRVQRLTETRDLAVDAAATELRRIERDLHDGAQARLVALGMNLRAVERMLPGRPEAALALVAEARETSLRALNDLRDLVRGICPPVLADRGLGHAVRALALDTPFPVDLDIDLPGRLTAPVESACYFAVAEALANAVRHSGARQVHIRMHHAGGVLRIQVADDGAGGADPALGTGLRGVEQRLAAFDGILAVSSPPGGPTMIAMEVPCALSSPKIFSS
jgi:signal transduction histidine kinase